MGTDKYSALNTERKLHAKITSLQEKHKEMETKHQAEITALEAKVKDLTHRIFGKKKREKQTA